MFCDEALEAVEAIAAGELTPDGRVAEHFASCPHCAAALESARQLDGMLRRRPVPRAPADFTARTMSRVRRARWRTDQLLDAGFNVTIALVIVAIVAGIWLLLHRTGLTAVGNDAVELFGTGLVTFMRRVTPSLPLYAGATALLATALAVWWWAERDATF
jgi:anti-sigma factor RsiW